MHSPCKHGCPSLHSVHSSTYCEMRVIFLDCAAATDAVAALALAYYRHMETTIHMNGWRAFAHLLCPGICIDICLKVLLAPCTGRKQQTKCGLPLAMQVKSLRELVTLPLKFPQLFSRYNMKPPRGVLLWGPPGTGKTCLARAAAAEVGVPLFIINGPDVVSQFYGESEAGLQGRCFVLYALSLCLQAHNSNFIKTYLLSFPLSQC